MPTGNLRTNFADKRNLPQTRFKETFFDYLAEEIFETAHRIWGSRRGVFGAAVLQGDGADKLKVSSLPVECLDGGGHILVLESADAAQVQFENANGVTYYVGARHCLVPSGVERNPRTGLLDYDTLEDRIGVTGVPNSVTEVAGTLRLVVDSVCESGVSCAGRKVTVWLSSPKTTEEDVAIERDLTVQWSGGQNVVVTSGLLGQGSGATSAILTDYQVAATGLTVRRYTDLRTEDPFAFLGTVTGVGAGIEPSAFSTADQIDVSAGLNPTLDLAYDGGPDGVGGSGRKIRVDSGAVELETLPGEGEVDPWWGQLRLTRLESEEWGQFMIQAVGGDVSAIPIATMQPLSSYADMVNSHAGEPATLSGARQITLTRVGVDLTHYMVRLNGKLNVVLLEDCPQAGLYIIDTFTANTIQVNRFDGTPPASWPGGTATCRILLPRFTSASSNPASARLNWWQGHLFVLRDGYYGQPTDFRIMPEGSTAKVTIYDNSKVGGPYYEPRDLVVVYPGAIGEAVSGNLRWPTKFKRSVLINGGNVTGATGEESFYSRDGLRIWNAGGYITDRDARFPLVVDHGFPEDVPTYHTWPTFAVEDHGALDRGHHFRDDFLIYNPGSFTSLREGAYYTYFYPNPGGASVYDGSSGDGYGHGCIQLRTGTAVSDVAEFGMEAYPFNLDSSKDFRWTYRARLKVSNIGGYKVAHGFYRSTVNRRFYFILNYIDDEYYWRGGWLNPDLTWHVTDPICGLTADVYQWFEIYVSSQSVIFTIDRKDHAVNSYGSAYASITSLAGQAGCLSLNVWSQTQVAAQRSFTLDYWEVWDREILRGRFGNSYNMTHGS